jgi:HSP20 family molecular chaperone IbpA
LSFKDDFDEIFNLDIFDGKFMKKVQRELSEILDKLKNGETNGTWKVRHIDEPGVRGYVIQGYFGSNRTLEPLEPMKPQRRRPMPERPFSIPEDASNETREPLTDIFEEDKALKIYVELPGEEESDIKLGVKENNVEIKAKNFHKTLALPNRHIDTANVSSKYKNGVLEITIPMTKEHSKKNSWKETMV